VQLGMDKLALERAVATKQTVCESEAQALPLE
jgi:hypothetical protein